MTTKRKKPKEIEKEVKKEKKLKEKERKKAERKKKKRKQKVDSINLEKHPIIFLCLFLKVYHKISGIRPNIFHFI